MPHAHIQALREKRAIRAIATLGSGYFTRVLSILVSVLSLPLTLSYLGAERFGLWAILSSTYLYLTATDFGLGYGITNRIAHLIGADDKEEGKKVASTAILLSLFMGTALGSLLVGCVLLLPVAQWFKIEHAKTETEFKSALLVLCAIVAVVLPVNTVNRIQDGYQETYNRNLWTASSGVITIGFILLCVHAHLSLAFLVGFVLGTPIALNLGSVFLFLKKYPQVRFSSAAISWRAARELLHVGKWFFLTNITVTMISSVDALLIGRILNPASVTPFFFASRIVGMPLGLLASIPGSLWPAFAEARGARDTDWIKSTFFRITSIGIVLTALCASMLAMWGNSVLELWAGPQVKGPASLLIGLAVYMVVSYWNTCVGVLVAASVGARTLGLAALLELVLKLGATSFALHTWGIDGVGWAGAFAAFAGSSFLVTARAIPLLRLGFQAQMGQRARELVTTVAAVVLISFIVRWALSHVELAGRVKLVLGVITSGTLAVLATLAQNEELWRLSSRCFGRGAFFLREKGSGT